MADAYYFVGVVVGLPLVILLLAMLVGRRVRDSGSEELDWQPTRSPEREAELVVNDIDQMRASVNELRRESSKRSLEQAAKRSLDQAGERPQSA